VAELRRDLRPKVVSDLRKELHPLIQSELWKELFPIIITEQRKDLRLKLVSDITQQLSRLPEFADQPKPDPGRWIYLFYPTLIPLPHGLPPSHIGQNPKQPTKLQPQEEIRPSITEELRKQLQTPLAGDLREELRPKIEARLRQELRQSTGFELQEELRPQLSTYHREDWGKGITDTLRFEIHQAFSCALYPSIFVPVADHDRLGKQFTINLSAQVRAEVLYKLRYKLKTDFMSSEFGVLVKKFDKAFPKLLSSGIQNDIKLAIERELGVAESVLLHAKMDWLRESNWGKLVVHTAGTSWQNALKSERADADLNFVKNGYFEGSYAKIGVIHCQTRAMTDHLMYRAELKNEIQRRLEWELYYHHRRHYHMVIPHRTLYRNISQTIHYNRPAVQEMKSALFSYEIELKEKYRQQVQEVAKVKEASSGVAPWIDLEKDLGVQSTVPQQKPMFHKRLDKTIIKPVANTVENVINGVASFILRRSICAKAPEDEKDLMVFDEKEKETELRTDCAAVPECEKDFMVFDEKTF
jgi:hypothetical protein